MLTKKFIDAQLADEAANPTSFVPDLDNLAAFRLLAHAEIEDFLERKAKERIAVIRSQIASGAHWMKHAPELLFVISNLGEPPPTANQLSFPDINSYFSKLMKSAEDAIADNNGIKSPSFLRLSLLSGKTIDEVDLALSASLNSFGIDRGDVAHRSVPHTRSLNAPSAEASTVTSLLKQLSLYFDVTD